MRPRILVVDDEYGIRKVLGEILSEQGYQVTDAPDGTLALELVRQDDLNLVLLDYQLPDMDGITVLKEIKQHNPRLPVVMMSGFGTIRLAVEATRQGAYDFLEKPVDADRVVTTVNHALEQDLLRREVAALQAETLARYQMVGASPAMQQLYNLIERVAPSHASVLVLGESGVGKELAARAIHVKSLRSGARFVRINCAAIPQDLIESELFGHEKGSFTGAVAQKPGKLEVADGGTVFLDEIGDMSVSVQARLLRFLQDGEFDRVGGTEPVKVDVRVIAATNRDLSEEIRQRRFREDLYYRLNVVAIHVPPLRERAEDIPLLVEHFLERCCDEQGIPRKVMAADGLRLLRGLPWPGNVRELANFIQRCVVLLPQPVLTASEITPLLQTSMRGSDVGTGGALKAAREDFERRHILAVLADCDWNMTEAARVLEIDRTTLYRTFERLGIHPEKPDPNS